MQFNMYPRMDRIAFLLCCGLLAACGGDKAGTPDAPGEDGLPKPAAAGGSVTGMPNPGVADARPAPRSEPQLDVVELPEPVDAGEIASSDPATPPVFIEGPSEMLTESTMPEDANAPPPPAPEQSENRVPEDAER